MNPEDIPPGGRGNNDKLNNPLISKKLKDLWEQTAAKPSAPTESVEFMRARNNVLRGLKNVPPRKDPKK